MSHFSSYASPLLHCTIAHWCPPSPETVGNLAREIHVDQKCKCFLQFQCQLNVFNSYIKSSAEANVIKFEPFGTAIGSWNICRIFRRPRIVFDITDKGESYATFWWWKNHSWHNKVAYCILGQYMHASGTLGKILFSTNGRQNGSFALCQTRCKKNKKIPKRKKYTLFCSTCWCNKKVTLEKSLQ